MREFLLGAVVAFSAFVEAPAPRVDVTVDTKSVTTALELFDRPWIGVWLGDAVDGGVEIVALVPGGPAQLGELQVGDIILEANTLPITVQGSLTAVLGRMQPGDALSLAVLRSGQLFQAEIRTSQRGRVGWPAGVPPAAQPPKSPPVVSSRVRVGLRVSGVTPGLRKHYGAPENAGVLVTGIDPDCVAGEAGIRVGDILVQVGDQRILTPVQLENALGCWEVGAGLEATVVRGGQPHVLTLAFPAEQPAAAAQAESLQREQKMGPWASQERTEPNRTPPRLPKSNTGTQPANMGPSCPCMPMVRSTKSTAKYTTHRRKPTATRSTP